MADFNMPVTSDENADLLPSSTLQLLDKLTSRLNGYELSCAQVLHLLHRTVPVFGSSQQAQHRMLHGQLAHAIACMPSA